MDYSKYGISESYLPTVYHNRIVIDKTTAATVNKNLTESAYIQGTTGFLGNESDSTIQTLVTVNMNIVFNVPNYADFVNLTKDDDFASSFKVESYLCWKNPNRNINAVFVNGSPNFVGQPALSFLPQKYTPELTELASNINNVDKKVFSLATVFNNIAKDSLNLTNFDNFTRYQRKFPDGQIYFQVPYTVKFQVPFENIPQMYFLSVTSVQDFDIDLNLNFGGFEIDDDNITSISALEAYNLGSNNVNYGPLIVDTLINNGNTQTKGVLYTIAQNQSTYQGQQPPEGVDLQQVTNSDTLREEKFNDLKGTPWLGGVHVHQGRYMAGSMHSAESHPFLDANVVLNKKLIDLRPIKQIKDQSLNFKPVLSSIKSTKINYFSDDSKSNFLEKLTVISDPLLSTNKDSNIDGFFAINYTNFLRKHSVFSNLMDKQSLLEKLNLARIVKNTLKIKILRHDVSTKISKIIFDSSLRSEDGIFYEKPSLLTKQVVGNTNNVQIPLGYLNVSNVAKDFLNINQEYSFVEFYTFTDLDDKKLLDTEYKYEVEIEMVDPVFNYLSNGIGVLDKAIRGDGATLGLQQLLDLITIKTGKSNVVSVGKEFPYVVDDLNQQTTNEITNSTIIDAVKEYDRIQGVQSITDGDNPKLILFEDIFQSEILFTLGITSGLGVAFQAISTNILDFENAGGISIDLFRLIINTLSSIRDNLKDAVNAISNVDITTQSFGYRAPTLSAQNGNIGKRIIREKTISDNTIMRQEYGFDYLRLFPVLDNEGLKQIPAGALRQVIDTIYLPKFFDTTQSDQFPTALKSYLDNYGYSTLTLTKPGVILPEGLSTQKDSDNWSNLLQFLLLFINKNVSKVTQKTAFTYSQNDASSFKFDINKNILGLSIVNEDNINLLKSLDRGQKQLVTKGLSIQDEIKTDQSIFVEYDNQIHKDENESQSPISIDNLKRNNISDYFLSYINNAVENGDKNKNKDLDGINALALFPAANQSISNIVKNQTIPAISLVEYYNVNSQILGQPEAGISYRDYYENRVWSAETKKLFFDQFADFFFDFVNSVKIEYLVGFDSYDYNGILSEDDKSKLDQFNNIDLSGYNWQQLENFTLSGLNTGQTLLCKMVDFVPEAFEFTKIPLIEKLKFYKKYYNYFLIIKGQKDLQIKDFGSSI